MKPNERADAIDRRSFLGRAGVSAMLLGTGLGTGATGRAGDSRDADALPWAEPFDQADGTTVHDGETAWQIESADAHPSFAVRSGALTAEETDGEGRWLSEPIDVSSVDAVDVTVTVRGSGPLRDDPDSPPAVVGSDPPRDPDGDGRFEDVDGDGSVDLDDAVALFDALESEEVSANADAFDRNCNGDADYDDVVTLARNARNDGDDADADTECGRVGETLTVSYLLDGNETVVATYADDVSREGETVEATVAAGDTLRIVITARTTDPKTTYRVDSVQVTGTGDGTGGDGPGELREPTLFFDDFESGSMAEANTLSLDLNRDGFYWQSNNRTSVVQDEWPDGGRSIWSNGEQDVFAEGRDWRPRSGRRSLRFRYPAGESWAEQRFWMNDDATGYPEIWIGFWIRVPHNYSQASGGGSPTNDKFLAVWTDGYSIHGTGPTGVFNLWSSHDEEPGSARATVSGSLAERDDGQSYSHTKGIDDFIVPARDQGRWMYSVHRLTMSSAPGEADGVMQWWRRWEDEAAVELVAERTDYVFSPPEDPSKPQGWNKGYLLGWSNPTYAEDTEFLIDDFALSTEPLIEGLPEQQNNDG
ncbi:hypothetical protein [Natrinema salaciae]|uniref:Uncharacterized protein n=1 Tax=Natrinema salaciae TaxID=1186196 RepID=A0A1H9GBI8_9EURY|nr:hypothetical protein [Natrinema salaciae]SEQ47545.1 hypothetical protein SAMN04489841_1837 [Natrinema salaciae]